MIKHHKNHVNYSLTSLPTTWLLVGYRNTKQVAICTYVMNTTTYTCVKWTWRTELQKENVLHRIHVCMCACVRAERKSITWSKCWIRVIEYREAGSHAIYTVGPPLHNLYISYELAWPAWTEILGVKTRGRCQQQYFPTPHYIKWSCTYFIEQQNVEGRGWTGFTNAIAALPTVICLLNAIREKGAVKKRGKGSSYNILYVSYGLNGARWIPNSVVHLSFRQGLFA